MWEWKYLFQWSAGWLAISRSLIVTLVYHSNLSSGLWVLEYIFTMKSLKSQYLKVLINFRHFLHCFDVIISQFVLSVLINFLMTAVSKTTYEYNILNLYLLSSYHRSCFSCLNLEICAKEQRGANANNSC